MLPVCGFIFRMELKMGIGDIFKFSILIVTSRITPTNLAGASIKVHMATFCEVRTTRD